MANYIINWTDGRHCGHEIVEGYNAALQTYDEMIRENPNHDVAFPLRCDRRVV
jgi:hypothetical protein